MLGLANSACPSDSDGPSTPDMPDAGFESPDAASTPDSGPADMGTPDAGFEPCNYDKGGFMNRGCEEGEVCNLAMDPPQCVPGRSCMADIDCRDCSALQNPEECGHGYPLNAYCDTTHGNVCVRSKAPCEPCETDRDCGFTHPFSGGQQQECVLYEATNERFCSRPSSGGCPDGFESNEDGQCVRPQGCDPVPVICPPNPDPIPDCAGTGQICDGDVCPDTGDARCSTNDQPGALGICIGFCTADADCPATLPICNTRNGICISGCTRGTCPAGQACHLDGFCAAPCEDNDACENDARYGPETYCNTGSPLQPPPRYFKTYHDPNSCQALGCERAVDCGGAGQVCDLTFDPPECVDGCFTSEDCRSGELCKDAPQPTPGTSYSREQCRAFPTLSDDNNTLIGTCCSPGCLDRNLQCGINEWCCGEPDSPYEDPTTCLSKTSTGGRQAQPGECFELVSATNAASVQQWCTPCTMSSECNMEMRIAIPGPDGVTPSWYPGFNVDPDGVFNGGAPFREIEVCLGLCSTTCSPEAEDSGCPGRQVCEQIFGGCFSNEDCSGLTCVNANPNSNPPQPGQCQCGENGIISAACPSTYPVFPGADQTVPFPRCVEAGPSGEMYCVVTNTCRPRDPIPEGCGF